MKIIPVIDLLDGLVVHARQGLRHRYQPIKSCLTASSKPLDIVKALMDLHSFETLYIADLNAIQQQHQPTHTAIISDILQHYPNIQIWLDAGRATYQLLNALNTSKNVSAVLGTESFSDINEYRLYSHMLEAQSILSLDFMPDGYQGPKELLERAINWPAHVIAMTLLRVGTNSGVDVDLLQRLLTQATTQHIYAAGGIRNHNDLAQLHAIGMHGALVATALHNQQIGTYDLTLFTS